MFDLVVKDRTGADDVGYKSEKKRSVEGVLVYRIKPVRKIGTVTVQSLHLVKSHRSDHREFRNVHLQLHPIDDAFHEVGPDHLPDARFEIAAGHVLMGLTWLQNRLLADDAVAFHFPPGKPGVGDKPVSP